ncbi:elongation factor EF-3 [Dunaliella salina]|uniref:Elongation factor 3 n=1 Tax=Dunaliella salina TaxID=3046 RepID=A0ABQ7GTS5_DUNSA|nr:elongation factor EF-3 [Dunaliella salina]|eukprot:KAF5838008.1 elongation factor EF-3 [Dunaliella salina]
MPGYAEEELAAMSLKPNGQGNGIHANGKEDGMGVTAYGDHSRVVGDLMDRLCMGGVDATSAAHEIALMVLGSGVGSMDSFGFTGQLQGAAEDMASPGAREGAMQAYKALAENVGRPVEPYLVPMLGLVLERHADKSPAVRTAAEAAADALTEILNPPAASLVLEHVLEGMSKDKPWQCKEGSLKLLRKLATTAKAQVQEALPDIVPVGSECMVDAREKVKKAAYNAMSACFKLQGNRDIEPCVPLMLNCIARPTEANNAIVKLSATTFVQQVDNPALSIMVPLLIRGLRSNETHVKRKTAIIIANMSKLVNNPADATVFLPRLLPGLKILSEEVADPECRQVAAMAHATLQRIEQEAEEVESHANKFKLSLQAALPLLQETVEQVTKGAVRLGSTALPVQQHVGRLACHFVDTRMFNAQLWQEALVPYLEVLVGMEEAEAVAKSMCDRCKVMGNSGQQDEDLQEDVNSELLCNCEFSLAYGGKILLNGTKLVLRRGRRYGLCGANGVGKSTLMRAIAANKVEGFPPPDQLRTVYVEHDIQGALEDLCVVDYILADPLLKDSPRSEVEHALGVVGFTDEMKQGSITSLSGGWKMKLALARAMLLHADILLLDEPTNHLDTTNVAWLVNYLRTQPGITALIVSHDSAFLDNVCTDILHYESRKLKRYRGNISEFVKVKPEAKSYYELGAATLKFTFPEPAPLDGVTSRQKSILNMKKVTFQYPNANKKALVDVTCHVRLDSRVAVLGRNGAGKSTLIKILTSELKPENGGVTRHPNLRVAYVAQHAFHHLEQCLDISPARYILRRYSGGEDKEEATKVHRQMTGEEWDKIKKQIWTIDGQPRQLDKIVGRRKKKRSYEYEVAWVGLTSLQYNRWITREELVERGFEKLINDVDGKSAAQQKVGEQTRPLTMAAIEEFCRDFGLDPEFSMHSNIRGLSGGQKVKLVLAAAMWQNPHMLIMDEPTNYLDREALGALADAIKRWTGGVVVISHHQEFIGAVCSEVWHVADGRLTATTMEEYKQSKVGEELVQEDVQVQKEQNQQQQQQQ